MIDPRPCRAAARVAALGAVLGAVLFSTSGCDLRQRMYDQPKKEPHEASTFYADGLSARLPVEGTVARGQLHLDEHYWKGTVDGEPATTLPPQIDFGVEFLQRGHERFDIYCSPCHGRTGEGNGMIVQRGLKRPPSFHQDRLRQVPIGHFFDVMTNGFGAMYSYASRVPVKDRWAIAAYVRALQLSQRVDVASLSDEDRRQLEHGGQDSAAPQEDQEHHP